MVHDKMTVLTIVETKLMGSAICCGTCIADMLQSLNKLFQNAPSSTVHGSPQIGAFNCTLFE